MEFKLRNVKCKRETPPRRLCLTVVSALDRRRGPQFCRLWSLTFSVPPELMRLRRLFRRQNESWFRVRNITANKSEHWCYHEFHMGCENITSGDGTVCHICALLIRECVLLSLFQNITIFVGFFFFFTKICSQAEDPQSMSWLAFTILYYILELLNSLLSPRCRC